MVELRKRKIEAEGSESRKRQPFARSFFPPSEKSGPASLPLAPKQGDVINLDGFGGEFDLSDGEKATLRDLVAISVGGIVLFTYPKASTPGCE